MKKFLLLNFVLFFMFQPVYSNPQSSNNAFEIPIGKVPQGESSKGLSNGAVTAIALGSAFGGVAALGGLGWYFAHRTGIACGYACGCDSPYTTILMSDFSVLEKLKLDSCKNKYLIKAFEYINLEKTSSKRYLLVQDLNIKRKTYNTVFFDLPDSKELNQVKIIQVSDSFTIKDKYPGLDTKILLNPNSKTPLEVPTTVIENDSKNGILVKQGVIKSFENKTAALLTENKMTDSKVYAIILEFSK